MYKLQKKIKSGKFDIVNNKLLYSYHNLFYENNIVYKGKISNFNTFKSEVFVIDNYAKLVRLNLLTKNSKEFNYIDGVDLIINEKEIIYGNWNEDYSKRFITLINLETQEKKWTIESYFGNGEISDNFLYASCTNNHICKIDLNDPEKPLWQFDLTTLGTYTNYNNETQSYKVEKILGIHNERLYLGLSGSLIVELDIATGTITYKWLFKDILCSGKGAGVLALNGILDTSKNEIIILSNNYYMEINLQTKQSQGYCMQEELNKHKLFTIQGNTQMQATATHIYSTVTFWGDGKHIWDGICAVNRNTQKIDWLFTDKKMALGTDKPKIAGDKLYQLALDGTLYIFKKQENETV